MVDTKTKKHKVSKKTKKSWRKHIDIKDVDAFLEDKRLQERLGVSFSERTDSELFVIDKTVDAIKNVTPKYTARLILKNKEPRCFASLKPHTNVPDPISKRNRVKPKICFISQRREAERKRKGILKLKERDALKNRMIAKTAFANRPKRGEIKNDVWDTTKNLLPETLSEWMSSDGIRHTMKYLGVTNSKLPSSLHTKSSVLPAVEAPHPGTSYNPSYTDHQELLHGIVQNELELMKQEEHLDRVTTQMFKKIPLHKRDEYLMKEISEGLLLEDRIIAQSDENYEEEDSFGTEINRRSVKNVKKTRAQRRKQREQIQESNERKWAKSEKKKVSDIYKLTYLQMQIETREKKQELLRQKRMKKRQKESITPKVLSKMKFEPMDPDFQLAEELSGNLRNCKPSNNLLKERYKSLQQRNIVAPTVIKLKRDKAKVKKIVKADHKINLNDIKL